MKLNNSFIKEEFIFFHTFCFVKKFAKFILIKPKINNHFFEILQAFNHIVFFNKEKYLNLLIIILH